MRLANGLEWNGPDGAALASAVARAGERFGILFSGEVGSGKTTAARTLAGPTARLVDCARSEQVAWLETWKDWLGGDQNLVLDELGRSAWKNDYGIKSDPVADFLRDIHQSWKMGYWAGRLFATTNADGDGLASLFDESVLDRLLEMCIQCRFDESRRPLAGSSAAMAETPKESTVRPESSYRWDEYESHGINTDGELFRAARWASAFPGYLMDAIRIMRVNFNLLSPEDCEKARAVCYANKGNGVMQKYLRDAFIYAFAAPEEERAAFARGFAAYASAVCERDEEARSRYNPSNAAILRDWFRKFDFGEVLERWRGIAARPASPGWVSTLARAVR